MIFKDLTEINKKNIKIQNYHTKPLGGYLSDFEKVDMWNIWFYRLKKLSVVD